MSDLVIFKVGQARQCWAFLIRSVMSRPTPVPLPIPGRRRRGGVNNSLVKLLGRNFNFDLGNGEDIVPSTSDDNSNFDPSASTSAWSRADGKFWPVAETTKELPPGIYRIRHSDNVGLFLEIEENNTDELIRLPDSKSEEVLEEIKFFRTLKEEFSKRGFLHKRGILLWGDPGSGKTCTVQFLIKLIVEQEGGIALRIDRPQMASEALKMVRRLEQTRPIICIMEDIDAMIEEYGESEYLAILDGESQIDDVVFVATTNYPEQLDKRFVDRPSRFDTIKYIGMPNKDSRKLYLTTKAPDMAESDVDFLVRESDGYSLAHLRELIVLVMCFKVPRADAIKRVDQFKVKKSSGSKEEKPSFGFVPD